MQLALECPTYLLKDIQPLADFFWALTHLVLEDETYADFYRNRGDKFLVLDNSVNELLEPCPLSDMDKAAKIVNPDYIVPPDWLGNSSETERALDEGIELWRKDRILPCIQGSELKDVRECADHIVARGFGQVAVPYDILHKRTDSLVEMATGRMDVIKILSDMEFDSIHLLGMTTISELEQYKGNKQIKSIDTGIPIVYGMHCKYLDESWGFKKDRPTMSQMDPYLEDFMDTSIGSDPRDKFSAIFWNIAKLRQVINGI